MTRKRLYTIGAVFAIVYLIYGVFSFIKALSYPSPFEVTQKKTEEIKIPDIGRFTSLPKSIRIRHELFGKTKKTEPRAKQVETIERVETRQPKTLSLKGVIVTPDGQFRAIIKPEDSKPVTLKVGDEVEGYIVQSIKTTEVILTKDSDTLTLKLYKKSLKEH